MDEGLVALIAAGVGLAGAIGGAAIGGYAAARGARIGAETAARATARQVQDQAAVDHTHWLRERRLEAYQEFLKAYEQCAEVMNAILKQLAGEPDPSDLPDFAVLDPCTLALYRIYFLIRMLGPEEVRREASNVRHGYQDHVRYLRDWSRALLDGHDSEADAAQAEAAEARRQMKDGYSAFVRAANEAMSTPVNSDAVPLTLPN
ncbi:hypothetical protein ACIRPU_16875 [Streptomyces sp. NPDC102259]|uniref:hypothetical protein n=1 Tax=Streptomyces sp. NPDC102259 TaxID=3366148 RepID=UPI0037FD58C3